MTTSTPTPTRCDALAGVFVDESCSDGVVTIRCALPYAHAGDHHVANGDASYGWGHHATNFIGPNGSWPSKDTPQETVDIPTWSRPVQLCVEPPTPAPASSPVPSLGDF